MSVMISERGCEKRRSHVSFYRLGSLGAVATALCLGLLFLSAGCRTGGQGSKGKDGAAAVRTFQVRGVVKEIQDGGKVAVIRHEAVPGYMAAMTMPFDVKDPGAMRGVQPGDRVGFRLSVTETDGWIDELTVLEPDADQSRGEKVESVRPTRVVEELTEGAMMPDYSFVDEYRHPVRLSQYRGQALAFTFIYTRCPYPTFCPRMSSNFAEACELMMRGSGGVGATNWHLLSISFDPEHDTPTVLRNYARRYPSYDPARWSFLTGKMIDIDAITEQFGMFFARDGESFSHNVRTIILDPAGRIHKILAGNSWKPESLVEAMRSALAGAKNQGAVPGGGKQK